jgi:DNA-directed RNA polymerase specialized sigma24 family protein
LAGLPEPQREVIVLRIWSGATFEEIAAVTGMALSTCHHH